MFRLLSTRSVPALLGASTAVSSTFRFQSDVAGEAVAAGRRQRYLLPTRWLPKFEIHDVRDDPAQGSMTRVAVDGKQLLISQHPQLGPRKVDPNDGVPQFDAERRVSLRFRHMDMAALVAVVEKRLPSHHMKNNAYDLTFAREEKGYSLKGQVHRGSNASPAEDWTIRFENQFATTLEHFLESALTESFGFRAHASAANRRNNNNNNNNNNNRQNNRNNRNNNNRNQRNRRDNNNNNNERNSANASDSQ